MSSLQGLLSGGGDYNHLANKMRKAYGWLGIDCYRLNIKDMVESIIIFII